MGMPSVHLPVTDDTTLDAFAADAPQGGGVAVTARVDVGGEPCAECGERTTRRWTDGERLVCTRCADWCRDQQA